MELAASVSDIFQGAKVGFIIRTVRFGFAAGGTIRPWLGGWRFEVTGNYAVTLAVAMALFAAICAPIWFAAFRMVCCGQRRATWRALARKRHRVTAGSGLLHLARSGRHAMGSKEEIPAMKKLALEK
jgi:hypothetical protein